MKNKDWTGPEVQRLVSLYPRKTNAEIAELLGRTESAIQTMGKKLRLRKDPDFRKQVRVSTIKHNRPKESWTKGRSPKDRMSPEKYAEWLVSVRTNVEKAWRARALPEGSRRWHPNRGVEVKINGKWHREAVVNWEAHNGPVPKGMIVICKDGDRWNTSIDNLKLSPEKTPGAILYQYPSDHRKKIHYTRRRKMDEELDRVLAEIQKSNNNIYYRPQI